MLHFRQLGVKIIRAMYLGFVYEFCQVSHMSLLCVLWGPVILCLYPKMVARLSWMIWYFQAVNIFKRRRMFMWLTSRFIVHFKNTDGYSIIIFREEHYLIFVYTLSFIVVIFKSDQKVIKLRDSLLIRS